jgi:pimeloyl-ACP methyl ester carboxylesterase
MPPDRSDVQQDGGLARAGEVTLAYGIAGAGPPLLLVAGTGFAGGTWPPGLVERLAEHFRVITFDHRGTGRSSGSTGPYSTRQFAADALTLLDHLGVYRCHVLGHSMGGRVAQWMALDASGRVVSLVLAATGPGRYREDQANVEGVPLAVAVALGEKGYERFIADHLRATFFTPEAAFSLDADRLVAAFWRTRPSLQDYLKHVIARQRHRTTDRVSEITQPALVLVGDRDTHVGGTGSHVEQSEYLAEHLRNAELSILADVSHGYFWQATDASADRVLDWLQEVR